MEPTSRIVTVDIHGQRYPIKSSLDAAYVAELAAYVDQKMKLALQECPSGDTLKVAVLAALNIADEYFRAGDERLAVHPLLRLKPPRVLGRYEPQHVLCGHGVGVHGPETPEALREALETARRRLPRAWIGALRPRRRTSD